MGRGLVWGWGSVQCGDLEGSSVSTGNGLVWGWRMVQCGDGEGVSIHLGSGALGDNYPGRTTDPQILLDLVHSSAKVISNKGCFIFF